ncbi:hypothetical protein [Chitinivorax sp. B]|uniref:hypothetical protein n=1 Tax=Chitinivorax sp. B TaxID=2502235 RepID=UPI002017EB83|nr:hypothetical protein [Chitinivorax sp. B]
MSALEILSSLVHRLDGPHLASLEVIPWAAPVLSFGDLSRSKVATLGLNPSNREFVDVYGNELTGHDRRFHTLGSLGLKRWADVRDEHLEQIRESCSEYFAGNPYDEWFQALNKLIAGANASYYGMFADACHLDLVPYATRCKWVELSSSQRADLLKATGDALGLILRESAVDVLVLNGQSVIENLQAICGCTFQRDAVPDWTLPRRASKGVAGYAYTGNICQISGIGLGREISVLGYSHNIQSSFGVTTQVKTAIQHWITQNAHEVFC